VIGLALVLQLASMFAAAPASGGRPAVRPPLGAGGAEAAVTVQAGDTIPTLTLADALARSVGLNPNYVAALGRVGEAQWARTAAKVAFFVPSAQASLDYTKYSQAFFNIGTFNQSSTSSTFNLSGSYDIFSARKFTDLSRTAAELEGATATEAKTRYAAALLTESAYYDVLAGQELNRAAEQRATRAEEALRVARARVASGAAVQSDSLSVRLELARAQVALLIQGSTLRVARLELGRRVGLDGPAGAAALDPAPPPELPITLPQAVAQALEQGPEYRAARALERSAEADLKGRRGAYLPTLNLSAAHSRFDVGLFPNASNVSSLTITASLPLWNNGLRELQIRVGRTNRDVARAVRADLERAALRDVTAAYDTYETARAAFAVATDALVVAQENYRVNEARYQAGSITVIELIRAQNDLTDAESGLVSARYAARLALARLEAILGTRLLQTQGGNQ
jgi:outer membrane protein TolC